MLILVELLPLVFFLPYSQRKGINVMETNTATCCYLVN